MPQSAMFAIYSTQKSKFYIVLSELLECTMFISQEECTLPVEVLSF